MSRGAALVEALLVTLATPTTWPLALAVFLLRGGFVLIVLPIVVLPSPVGLGNLLAPTLMTVVFQGVSLEVVALVGLALLAALAWVVVGGLAAGTLEAEGARIVAGHEDEVLATVPPADPVWHLEVTPQRVAARVLAARLVAHVPTGVALLWGAARLVGVAYRELTSPFDVETPIVVRVLLGAPEVLAVVAVLWTAGEIAGALAARRIVLDGAGLVGALRGALATIGRRPLQVLLGFLVPAGVLVAVLLPSMLAATGAWTLVRAAMRTGGDVLGAAIAVVVFVTLWLIGLLLLAVTEAWRSAVWSIGRGDPGARPPRAEAGQAG